MSSSTVIDRPKAGAPAAQRPTVVIEEDIKIPSWVLDLATFRQWTYSDDFPERGDIFYLAGEIWVDLSMEQLFSHNQVKTTCTAPLWQLIESLGLGYLFSAGARWSHVEADFSTEPDAMFVAYDTLKAGRIRLIEGTEEGYIELEGTPDMALEIISPTSVDKDTKKLRTLYWNAGIPEYWLVDARGETVKFDLLRRTAKGYAAAKRADGWVRSKVFDREFKLTRESDPLGNPKYKLAVR